jgi:hypothetical protein
VTSRTKIPELDLARIRRFVDARVPPHATHQVRLEVEVQGTAVTIVECRAPWRTDVGPEWTRFLIARLRYSPTHQVWTLFWRDPNLGMITSSGSTVMTRTDPIPDRLE